MYELWDIYTAQNEKRKWHSGRIIPPKPMFIDEALLLEPLEAVKEPSGTNSFNMRFTCHLTLPEEIARALYLVSLLMLKDSARRHHVQKYKADHLFPTLTKSFIIQCLPAQVERIQNMLVESHRTSLNEMTGQTGLPLALIRSGRCVEWNDHAWGPHDVGPDLVEWRKRKTVIEENEPGPSISKVVPKRARLELQQGDSRCMEVPQLQSAILEAATSAPSLLTVIEQVGREPSLPDLNVAIHDPMLPLDLQPPSQAEPALVVDRLFLVARTYESVHPGRYHPREVEPPRASASIPISELPSGSESSDRGRITRVFDLNGVVPIDHSAVVASFEICASLGVGSGAADMMVQHDFFAGSRQSSE